MIDWNYSPKLIGSLIPVGLSFYIFKAVSYQIEVYRNNYQATRNFTEVALYLSYFPEVLSGPIDRPNAFIPQIKKVRTEKSSFIFKGALIFLWGLFQKIIIADRISILVNRIYDYPLEYGSFHLVLATFFFAFQIYCDFSGYTDMAIGISLMFGINLMKNFDKPYIAISITDFWRRWHISLSSWLRDYIFLPLSYSLYRISGKYFKVSVALNLVYLVAVSLTMLIAGFWHGAAWNFVLWGFILAILMIISRLGQKFRLKFIRYFKLTDHKNFLKYFRIMITFFLICFSWIFFRSNTVSDSFYIITAIITGFNGLFVSLSNITFELSFERIGINFLNFLVCLLGILVIIIYHIKEPEYFKLLFRRQPTFFRYAEAFVFIIILYFLGNFSAAQFIYFKF